MKLNKIIKRAVSAAMAAVIALSSFPVSNVLAYTGEKHTVTYDFTYDSNGNKIKFNSNTFVDGRRVGDEDDNRFRISVDGKAAFCLEPGVKLYTGATLTEGTADYWYNLSAQQREAIGLALLYGYSGNRHNLSGNDDEQWIATQSLIWDFVTGCRETTGSYRLLSYDICNIHFGESQPNYGVKAAYDDIVDGILQHDTIPSFMSGNESEITKELVYNSGTYSLTLTDTNNILSAYTFSCSDSNISLSKQGNKLTLTSNTPITGKAKITARKNNIPTVSESSQIIIYGDDELQDVITGAENVGSVYAYMSVETPTGFLSLKKTSEDGKVAGITFKITGNGVNKTVTTDNGGNIFIEGLAAGTYTVTEQTIDRYVPQQSQTVTIIGGRTSTVTFNNTLKRGSLKVIKSSEDKLVKGITFRLYGTSLSGAAVDQYAVTDDKGVATFENVLISGTTPYTVEEVNTDIRYVVPPAQKAPIEWNKVTSRSFINSLKKFNVTLTKSDSKTKTAQGDGTIAGAVYGVYKGDELVDTYSTDKNGQFTTKYYVCDNDWTIKEITPSRGYLLDTTVHKIGAKPELYTLQHNSVKADVVEQAIMGSLSIIKHSDNGGTQIETPESGAVFEVFLKAAGSYENAKETERDILTCDENGFAKSKDMPYGLYTVRQTAGWQGRELMKDFDVYISQNSKTYRYIINNSFFESHIKVVKKDAETGKTIPYAGAGFQIYDPDGDLVTMNVTYPEHTVIDTFYTTAEGELITPLKLPYGKNYSLVERFAPYEYTVDSTPIFFDITQENSADENGVTVIKVEQHNIAQKGTISINKSGEVFASVTESDGIYQPVYEIQGLGNAVYEITAAEDIYTPDGTMRASKGEIVDTVITDENGNATSKELYLGKYEVREKIAPDKMVVSNEAHSIELLYAGQDVKVTETSTEFINERQRVAIALTKLLEVNDEYGIGTNKEILDVTFGLFTAETLTAKDKSEIPADSLIEIISVDENGYGVFNTDLPHGNYYAKELTTNKAYILDDTKYPIDFEYAGQDIDVVSIELNEGEPISNTLIYGSIKGIKYDEDKAPLGGAVMGIFKPDTEEFTKENAIHTVISKEDGSFEFEKVPFGTWIVCELESPTGFVLSEERFEVTIGAENEVIEIELVNEFIKGNIELLKLDEDYPENNLSGAVFGVYSDVNANKELEEADIFIGEMTELEGGIHKMADLRYGHYLVKEKTPPPFFIPDENVYPVFIEENEKTYVVENKAGVGFVNAAQKGSLKILKTSADGKVEGFSFRVTGVNGYDEIFTTDSNGEILIENLRVGDYVVSEIEDEISAGYILPDDVQITVKADETVTAEMYNDKYTPPKTGDDFNRGFWTGLGFSACIGAVIFSVLGLKAKPKDESEEE